MDEGNRRFSTENPLPVNNTADRRTLAAKENQGKYAYATVLSCSDSRVPVELIFDAGVMDIFTIRVAGNVCNTDEVGCVEYGVCHVNTPLVIVMGHSQCGAVTAVLQELQGHGHKMEDNIPPLVASLIPPVRKVLATHPSAADAALLNFCIEEAVWQDIENLFLKSTAVRAMVKSGKVKVIGAIYDIESGRVKWLPENKVTLLLEQAEKNTRHH